MSGPGTSAISTCTGRGVARASLNDFDYDWPMGFARFEIGVLNARRARYEPDEAELHDVGRLLGHPLVQVLAHS